MGNISIGGRISLMQQVASLDLRYGPYASINDAFESMGPNGDEVITAGLLFGVTEDDGTVSLYSWTKTEDATIDDCKKIDKDQIVLFNGFIDISVSIKQQSYGNIATKDNIVFLSDRKQFAYRDGLNFYINWQNRYIWSNNNYIPYDDVIYVDFANNRSYYFNGVTLVGLGSDIVVKSINDKVPDSNGNINISKEDFELGNVDNTADVNKVVKGANEDGSGNNIATTYETKADATAKQTALQEAIANLTGLDSTNFGGFSIQSTEADAISNIATLYTADGYTDELLWYMAGTSLSSVKAYRYNGSGTPTAISSDTYNCIDFSGLITEVNTLRQDLTALGPKIDKNTTNIANLQQEIDAITPIQIVGDVTNAPDEEDVTTDENNLLKLKDRPTSVNQKGYKILRKGVALSTQMVDTNTIYEVRYNFDLNGATLNVPDGCVLKFSGGKFANGTLSSSNGCSIDAPAYQIFSSDLTLSGFFDAVYSYVEWFEGNDDATRFELANALGPTRLLKGSLLVFDRQVNVVNSVYGTSNNVQLISGGAQSLSKCSVVCYIGNGGSTTPTAGVEANDSIFLLKNMYGITIEGVIFCTSSSDGLVKRSYLLSPQYSQNTSFPHGWTYISNPNFSGIKFTTDNGTGYRYCSIRYCQFLSLPIGINFYDLGLGTDYNTYDVNTDNHDITICQFSNCGIGINIANTNVYNLVITKPAFYGGSHTIRHINLLKGNFICIEGYFGRFSSETSADVKTCVYVGENCVGNYTLYSPYGESHYGYFIYDISNRGDSVKQVVNPRILCQDSGCPTMTFGSSTYNVNVYITGSNSSLQILGGYFSQSTIADNSAKVYFFGTKFAKHPRFANSGRVFLFGTNTSGYAGQFGIAQEVGVSAVSSKFFLGNGNNLVELTRRGNQYFDIGYNSKLFTLDSDRGLIIGSFTLEYAAKAVSQSAITSGKANTLQTFARKSDGTILSLGICNANAQVYDVFGNAAGTYYEGTTSDRPIRPLVNKVGTRYFDTDLNKNIYVESWNANGVIKWVEEDGEVAGIARSGTFANAPTPTKVGFQYFCTSGASVDGGTTEKTNIVIYYTGSGWVDANGNTVVAKV